MFGNFIYYIIVLLIYLTYQAPESVQPDLLKTITFFIILNTLFICGARLQFKRLESQIDRSVSVHFDNRLETLIARQTGLSVLLFAVEIYGLNLTSLFAGIRFFKTFPTLLAVLFLGLFVFYLSIIWAFAFNAHERLHRTGMSRRSYVYSNILFSVPVLLPWFVLSIIFDMLNALPFGGIGIFFSSEAGQAAYFLIFLFIIAIVGPAMIKSFWRCTSLEKGVHRSRIESFCERAGVAYADIMLWPLFGGRMVTAGVMGLIKKFRYILVTPSLLRFLEPDEIDAVIAHEVGHVKKFHLHFYLFFFAGYMFISYAIINLGFVLFIYSFLESDRFIQSPFFPLMFSGFIILTFIIYFRFVFGYFMRNFERQADAYVYSFFDNAKPLIATLKKISDITGQSPDKPNWHHFNIRERIAFLEKCETDKSWITRHNRKIQKSIAVYLICLLAAGGVEYQLRFGDAAKQFNMQLFEKIVLTEIDNPPRNPELYRVLGDLYVNKKDYESAVRAYTASLRLEPENPDVLNNLAWIYATCDNKNYRDYKKALMMAEKAAMLKTAAHILDTLAECYYVNGRVEDAIAAERHAVEIAETDIPYFKKQLDKFIKAGRYGRGV